MEEEKFVPTEEFVASVKNCKKLKNAISIIADSIAVDCLIDQLEAEILNREHYEKELINAGMNDLVSEYNEKYFGV